MKAIMVDDMVVSLEQMKSAKIVKYNTKHYNIHIEYHHQLEYFQNVQLIYLPKNELVELIILK